MHDWLHQLILEAQEIVPEWGVGGGDRRMNSSSCGASAAARFSLWKHNLSWYEGVIAAVVDGACMMPRKFRFSTIGADMHAGMGDKGSDGFFHV